MVASDTVITLKGSVEIVSEFFFAAINSILYQRGIYQPETFKRESKYGLTVLTTTDQGLLTYLSSVMSQMESWLTDGDVQRLALVVSGIDSGETLERWQFNVSVDNGTDGSVEISRAGNDENKSHNVIKDNIIDNKATKMGKKTVKEVHDEIQAIIRQITASVTFLPLLNEPCSFDLLIYTNTSAVVPKKWADSDPCYIMNSQEVKLRSFTTSFHKVDSMVTYKEKDEWEL
ncbi:mitotic spindle assembly checkpoint protein MAD2A [Skeletonema marinoi]|uniref:Mitotic spindle assembly checkpoint protein MAD2A n=1 Tax=Skeletonema marinoi TaxID=267567 RepID=A0AAD8Y951_9STRA|nr:mitotic spindle assembly checkpoint protein MAD2A [Skeletonema marinoi]